jgi:hypothetical protein
MKFGRTIKEQAIAEWKSKYLDYKCLKKLIKRLSNHNIEDSNLPINSAVIREENKEERNFLDLLSGELDKVENFFLFQLNEARKRTNLLIRNVKRLQMSSQSSSSAQQVASEKINDASTIPSKGEPHNLRERSDSHALYENTRSFYRITEQQTDRGSFYPWKDLFQHKKATNIQIRKAFIELYHYLELLKSFHSMNMLAYTKIVKKFEKNTHSQLQSLLLTKLNDSAFYESKDRVDMLMKEVVTVFASTYCNEDRKRAVKSLRSVNNFLIGPPSQAEIRYFMMHRYTFGIYLTGLFTGISIALFIDLLRYLYFLREPHPKVDAVVLLYFGLGFPLSLALLTSWNFIVFDLFKVNYRLIYGLRANPFTTIVYSCTISFFSFFYLALISFSIKNNGNFLFSDQIVEIWFIFLTIPSMAFIYCILYYPNNLWLLKVLGRIIVTPFYKCKFKDFYIADQLSSCQPFFHSLGFLIYISISQLSSQDSVPVGNTVPFSWYAIIFPIIPFYWRCLQCCRRYYDSYPSVPNTTQLWNSLRYFLNILCLLSLGLQIYYSESGFFSLSLFLYCIAFSLKLIYSLFSYYWDVIMDWGLGQGRLTLSKSHHPSTDSSEIQLMIYPSFFYYFAMITDFLTRFIWLPFYIMAFPTDHSSSSFQLFYGFYIYGFVEILRRFQWNFFRVEIEHIHNCEKYQVITEIQLPFALNDLFEFDEGEDEQEQESHQRDDLNGNPSNHLIPPSNVPSSSIMNNQIPSAMDIES